MLRLKPASGFADASQRGCAVGVFPGGLTSVSLPDEEVQFSAEQQPGIAGVRRSDCFLPTHEASVYKFLIDHLYDGVYFVDLQRRIVYWNPAAEQLTGYSADQVMGRACSDNILVHTDCSGAALCLDGCPMCQSMRDGRTRETNAYLRHRSGHRVPVSVRVLPIFDGQHRIVGAIQIFSDSTARRIKEHKAKAEEQISFLDGPTQIPNRRFVELRLGHALDEVRRYDRHLGALFVDIDSFQEINRQYGRDTGDEVLKVVAQTLTRTLRPGDTVGRWSDDEFMVIVPEVNIHDLRAVAERCRGLLAQSTVAHPGGELKITVSIGGSLITEDDTQGSLVHRMDNRLHESRKRGKNFITID